MDFTLPADVIDELELNQSETVVVPIAYLKKRKLRNFDITHRRESVPVLTKAENGEILKEALRCAAKLAFETADLLVDDDHPSWEALDRIVEGREDVALHAKDEIVENARDGNEVAGALLDYGATSVLIQMLPENYVLTALLPKSGARQIVKYGFDERLDMKGSFSNPFARMIRVAGETAGFAPLLLDIEVPAATRAASYHAELVIPEELRIEDAFALSGVPDSSEDPDTERLLDAEEHVDRGSFYLPGVSPDDAPHLMIGIRHQRAGFPLISAFVAALVTAVIVLGAWVVDINQSQPSATISVLLALSALLTGAVARIDEHPLVRHVLWAPRAVLGLVGVIALSCAASVGFKLDVALRDSVWEASALSAIVLSVVLISYAFRSLPLRTDADLIELPGVHDLVDSPSTSQGASDGT